MIRTDRDHTNSKFESINFAVIKIGNIPWEISTRDVVELVEPFLWKTKPNQNWVHIPIDRVTGKTLSDLFVEIPTLLEAGIICSNLDKCILKQRALSVSMSNFEELLMVLIKPEALITKTYLSKEDVDNLLDICINYKIHFSRKCAERPFEHILSLFRMIPWHSLRASTVELMYELLKCSIEALEQHLSRASNQIDSELLGRMIKIAQYYPPFSTVQIEQILNTSKKFIPIPKSKKLTINSNT